MLAHFPMAFIHIDAYPHRQILEDYDHIYQYFVPSAVSDKYER